MTKHLFLLAFLALTSSLALGEEGAPSRSAAPALKARSLDGSEISLEALRGKVVILSFWATWCQPCKKAVPTFEKLIERLGADNVALVTVAIDDAQTQSQVRGTAKRYGWKSPVIIDTDGRLASAFNPRGVAPFTLLIDREGKIAHSHEGFSPSDEESLAKRLEALVAEPKPAP